MEDFVKENALNDIYAELEQLIGRENMEKVFSLYKGQQITFPIRLYKADYIKKYIAQNPNTAVSEISRKFGYSERWIRQLKNKTRMC